MIFTSDAPTAVVSADPVKGLKRAASALKGKKNHKNSYVDYRV